MKQHVGVADQLLAIEAELRKLDLWQSSPPPATALASCEPFCIDTLDFTQWIQFILLPRLKEMVETGTELPANSGIAPMAEQALGGMEGVDPLIERLWELDRLLTEGAGN